MVEQDGKKQDNKKEDDVAILPTPNKPTEEEKPTIPSEDNNKPTTPTEPTNPVTPVQPVEPVVPVKPTEPTNPTNPVTPTQPSEELSEDEKQLDIKTKVVDGKEVKYAVGEATKTDALPELDISKLTAEPTTNNLNQ